MNCSLLVYTLAFPSELVIQRARDQTIKTNTNRLKMPEDPRLKSVRIKTGVVKRLAKEKLSYQKEAATLEEKLEAFKNSDAGADDAAVAR